MKVYINNEEVVCNRTLQVRNELSKPSSVILNNVYPKTWETDRDYVSRFYMPKDYSPVRVENENTQTKEYDLSNNIRTISSRAINYGKIDYWNNFTIQYIRVVPGYTYTIKASNYHPTIAYTIVQTDSLKIGSTTTLITTIQPQETKTISITPTKEYIVVNHVSTARQYINISKVSISVTDNLIFSGIIKNSGNIALNPRFPHYSTLQAIDYSTLLSEGESLNYVLEEMTISEAIKKLVTDQKGFMVGEILIDDETLAPYNCNEKTTYDVLEYLAEITGAKWFTKAICKDIVLVNFYMPSQIPEYDPIEYTQEYFTENNIDDISYSYNVQDYRNKQAIVNSECKASIPQVEIVSYNGSEITTTYPVYEVQSIKSGSRTYRVASQVQKQAGISANFYYQYGSNQIEGGEIATGTILEVTYYPVVQAREVAYNMTEIDRISDSTNRNGTISRYEKRTDTKNEEALSQIAKTYIDYKGIPEVILTIKTHNKDIFELGTQVLFNGPLDDLKTRYLVRSKQVEMVVTGNQKLIFYTYELSSSFNDETAINFFDNQRRKLEGNLSDNDYISRFIDIPSQTNIIFYGATITPVTIDDVTLEQELEVEL